MNRVLAARSLKYSEFRSQEGNRGARKKNLVVTKRENQKGQSGGKMKSFSNKYNSSDNSCTPSVVAEILMAEAKRKKQALRGFWSPLGSVYETHGVPDLELGVEANIDGKRNKVVANPKEARQKLEKLMELFRQTKSSLLRVNLFNRGGAATKSTGLLPAVNDGGSGPNTPRGINGEKRGPKSLSEMTTVERIAALGMKVNEKKVKNKKREVKKKLDHRNESRLDHLCRWRDQFDECKSSKDRGLISMLVQRAEERDHVYESPNSMNQAVRAAMLLQQKLDSQQRKELKERRSKKFHEMSLWQRAKRLEFEQKQEEIARTKAPPSRSASRAGSMKSGRLAALNGPQASLSPVAIARPVSSPHALSHRPSTTASFGEDALIKGMEQDSYVFQDEMLRIQEAKRLGIPVDELEEGDRTQFVT